MTVSVGYGILTIRIRFVKENWRRVL